jgi:plastocyanin
MKTIVGLLSFCLTFPLLAQENSAPGSLSGTVRFLGEVPPSQRIQTTDGGMILHNDLVVDGKTKGLRYVVAVLEDVPAPGQPEKPGKVVVDQRDMVFLPRVVALREGQPIRFENNDLCNHAVQAISTNAANTFNVLTPQNNPFETQFKAQKAPVQIGCPLHPWMRAWVFVLPHPFFAVSDTTGNFRIDLVPPGKYTLALTHPDTGHKERRPVEILPGKTTQLTVDWHKIEK